MTEVVQERIVVRVPAAAVYAAVSDVGRMGEWSPECVGATLDAPGSPLTVGSTFRGHNRQGRWRSWTTRCTVTAADPGRCFAFDVRLAGTLVSTWRFELTPAADGGTEVVQSWWDRRGPARRRIGALTSGVRDRSRHNRDGMRRTLAALKVSVECVAPPHR
ncbi:SRPBCC family protein [Micromonospora narathiwatensis]|uniref:Polyketide cyclase / dehydrase and lipid transport n=1 Tax=Micromonospora narathiwatensis TaxID=299146 RepID=A0A1A8ZGX5_9ACTN|nr:SRPBCC family protein [Micromonospora narathiwatensis]SBT43278.1 Polyketide cyclase / dehydrase and lipid transport [Micromonospora narathiwatensis]